MSLQEERIIAVPRRLACCLRLLRLWITGSCRIGPLGSTASNLKVRGVRRGCGVMLASLCVALPCLAQGWVTNGQLIVQGSLPGPFAATLQQMGGRLTTAAAATTSLTGTLTDSGGTRTAQVTVQAPGYLAFQDSINSRVIAYNGNTWQVKNGQGGQNDTRIEESLLAHLPDSFLLQLANGGSLRRIGGRFRTDNGKTPNYTGPYRTLYAYSPAPRQGLTSGQPLQQNFFVSIDEATWLIAEIRVVVNESPGQIQVTQTKFNNWFQQNGQW